MKLLIDIGNTNTSIAVSDGKAIRKRYFIHTSRKNVEPVAFRRLLGRHLQKIDVVVIVSVVPKFCEIIKRTLDVIVPEVTVLQVGKELKVPIRVKYKKPSEVGQDRLVTALAASRLYGHPALVIDFGTAVTFDYVNARSEYEGGLIFPGLRLGLKSLVENTALLPRVNIKATKGLIGRDTRSSMNKGIILGYVSLCDGIIGKFRKRYGKDLKIIATGGDAALIARYSSHIGKVCPDLIFEGLSIITAPL